MRNTDSARSADRLSQAYVPRVLGFVFLLAFTAILECVKLGSLRDPEIWGHLRSGTWILQNKTWPVSGLFSQVDKLVWRDFSWGFDVITGVSQQFLGLRAIPALLIFVRIALALLTFLLSGGWRNFWSAAGLSMIVQYLLLSVGPGPAAFSLVLFGLELLLLFEIRQSGASHLFFALPALFFLWANLDIGFIYGLVLYLLFLIALSLEHWGESRNLHWLDRPAGKISVKTASLTGLACIFASFLNPYGWHPLYAFFLNEFSAVNNNLPDYKAMGFRQPQDYLLMLLAMAAFLVMGLSRSRDLFQLGTLLGCTTLAFHAQRENGLLVLAAVAVIGFASVRRAGNLDWRGSFVCNWQCLAPYAATLVLVVIVFFVRVPSAQQALLAIAAEKLPVRAADFLRQHPQPQPLFNVYKWGGFLTWYLPEYPVAIDSRRGLYPEETELNYFKAMKADIPYREFPPMNQARTFLMEKTSVMGEALLGVSGFQVLYEDDISIVYSHEVKE